MGIPRAFEFRGGKHTDEGVDERLSGRHHMSDVRRRDRLAGGFGPKKTGQEPRQIERDHPVEAGSFLRKGGGWRG